MEDWKVNDVWNLAYKIYDICMEGSGGLFLGNPFENDICEADMLVREWEKRRKEVEFEVGTEVVSRDGYYGIVLESPEMWKRNWTLLMEDGGIRNTCESPFEYKATGKVFPIDLLLRELHEDSEK